MDDFGNAMTPADRSAGACPPPPSRSSTPSHPPMRLHHKPIRLLPERYAEPGAICSVTMAVGDRQPVFGDPRRARLAVDVLINHVHKTGIRLYAYCIMPDHLHVLVSPSATCGIIRFVGEYKNLTQRAVWTTGWRGAFWQTSFWDHFVRDDEDLRTVVEYILQNPVRKGLVSQWREYPFSGSLECAP